MIQDNADDISYSQSHRSSQPSLKHKASKRDILTMADEQFRNTLLNSEPYRFTEVKKVLERVHSHDSLLDGEPGIPARKYG